MAAPVTPADPDIAFQASCVDLVRDSQLLLDQVSVTIRTGEHWALLGPNGAGKSTLLQIMATYAYPTRGHAEILGYRLGRVNVFTLRPQIGHVSPHHRVDPQRTVSEVVRTGATGTIQLVQRRDTSQAELSRAAALTELMGLAGRGDSPWQVLSQGERSRALIARALMAQPQLLLLDEPAAGLDVAGREQLLASVDELRQRHSRLATVLVTHHLEELPASTTHALLLREGRVLASGAVDNVLSSELVSACFGHPVTISRQAGRWAARSAPVSMVVETPERGGEPAAGSGQSREAKAGEDARPNWRVSDINLQPGAAHRPERASPRSSAVRPATRMRRCADGEGLS